MNELNEYVRELRNEFPKYYVPDFDPNNGGIHAKVLFLFEKPGPKTDPKNKGSGYISQDNDDETARATKYFLEKAGLKRRTIVIWNAIPYWNGTIEITAGERRRNSSKALVKLLKILPKVKKIVLVGKEAENLVSELDLEDYHIIRSLHPSPRNRATRRAEWEEIPTVWAKAQTNIIRKFFYSLRVFYKIFHRSVSILFTNLKIK